MLKGTKRRMLKIRKNDTVYVIAGKDRGKTGKVMKAFPEIDSVLVEGINRSKKHMRRTRDDQKGGVIEVESPLHISNIQIYCRSCSRPTRIGMMAPEEGGSSSDESGKLPQGLKRAKRVDARIRICKRCKEII